MMDKYGTEVNADECDGRCEYHQARDKLIGASIAYGEMQHLAIQHLRSELKESWPFSVKEEEELLTHLFDAAIEFAGSYWESCIVRPVPAMPPGLEVVSS